MDQAKVSSISRQVYQKFPDLRGSHPDVKSYGNSQYLLIYNGKAFGPDGKALHLTVRVVTNEDGKIIKMTAAR